MSVVEYYYWCDVLQTWVQCTEEEYYDAHLGKSFTKRLELP